jgi:hypothetical protein
MITVEFTEAEAQAAADAVRAYIDDDYYPAIDLEALRTAYKRLTWTIGNPVHPRWPGRRPGRRPGAS